MMGRKKVVFDIILTLMAYLIFALSLIAVNIIKYQWLLIPFYVILVISGFLTFISVKNYSKDLK